MNFRLTSLVCLLFLTCSGRCQGPSTNTNNNNGGLVGTVDDLAGSVGRLLEAAPELVRRLINLISNLLNGNPKLMSSLNANPTLILLFLSNPILLNIILANPNLLLALLDNPSLLSIILAGLGLSQPQIPKGLCPPAPPAPAPYFALPPLAFPPLALPPCGCY